VRGLRLFSAHPSVKQKKGGKGGRGTVVAYTSNTIPLDVSTHGILGTRVQEWAFISAIVLVLEKVRGSQDGRVVAVPKREDGERAGRTYHR